jgi:hypothetical protein
MEGPKHFLVHIKKLLIKISPTQLNTLLFHTSQQKYTCYLDKCLYRVSVSLSQTYLVPRRKQGFRDGGEGALPELEGDGSPTVHHEVEFTVLPAAHVVSMVCSEQGSGSLTFWYGSGCGNFD